MKQLVDSTGTEAVILMGDFNTPPHYPAYALLQDGRITNATRKSTLNKTDRLGILSPVSSCTTPLHRGLLSSS